MKKLLLLLTALVGCVGMSHAEVLTINVNNTELGKTNTSYVTTAFDFTKDGITFNTNQINPSTGQVKVNAGSTTSVSGNFYLYNKTALPNISEIIITMVSGSAIASTKANLVSIRTSYAAITSASLGTDKGSIDGNTLTLTPSNSNQSYFRIDLAKIGGTVKFSKIEIKYGETGPTLNDSGIAYPAEPATVTFGEEPYKLPTLTNPYNLNPVTYTSSNEPVATIDKDGNVTIKGVGTTTITAKTAETEVYKAGEASYKLIVKRPAIEGQIVETITPTNFGIKDATNSYQEFTYTSTATNITYKAYAFGGQDYFQINKTPSGFVVTQNPEGKIAAAVTFEWGSNTSATRKVEFYGLYKAYTAAADLYTNPGTELATKAKANPDDTTFDIPDQYNFIGLKSADGAIYLNSITITWIPAVEVAQPATNYVDGMQLVEGDEITFEAVPGQQIYAADEVMAQKSMMRAATLEGWTPQESNKYTMTITQDSFNKIYKVKAVNGSATMESEPIVFGINSDGVTTGIEAIEAEAAEGEVEWFNLQGVRVENPANGLYIRRQGNTVSKVVVK